MRTAFITGATSGIGKAAATILAGENYRLILCGRRKEILEELAGELAQKTDVYTLTFDVRNFEEVQNAIASLPAEWQAIDILINNAGNAHGLEPLAEGKVSDWDMMMDGNVKGLLYVSRCIIPGMKERASGHIINISSVAALQTYANGVVYCASKKAVKTISEGMRLELTEFGIKITDLAPGAVETEFSEIRFKGDKDRAATVYAGYEALKAEDIADVISYVVNAPKHVTIADMTIYSSAQASPTQIFRK
ncbi:SDR family NAD(P)-dependent oxidoreductase [Elizabethkingia anophelis]|uniref:SDR family NAD(P)-dependent oxidoreductase n=1 Tax=Elizabethkingia anophelis TaxID=1117645 RepID=UPI002227C48B|nr:SDR family NAD(P)-dependent oxidoreductase [Elizabethkingia anophelis]MCW2464933.1 NADP-dependent 3-hydroxy acid dehydrogenase YdfG [Elizabethkingia anophelis]MCW2468616.1 NADP-dependent 3-hydroxy acid dehydrogenase YdfG [Elizabethkingia anophelis]MCW2472300.1 NADP-dependent 3-hydroxy acid dehydrogenase YdfG [Elizabethkingia anophelis]HBI9692329.1 SDR family NAD(P)-dependent oxidoreductase [Elizabethkingia anophelis]HBI9696349.1 SDR family NAD(P)-dependent oxidoreductase [Elizabethkingia an